MLLASVLFDKIINFISSLDNQLLLLVNGMHSTFLDYFMFLYCDRYIWIPLWIALFYLLLRVMSWKMALLGLVICGLIILFCDKITVQVIRPYFMRFRPSHSDDPMLSCVHIVNNYRGGKFGFPSAHSANSWALTFYIYLLLRNRVLTWFMVFWALIICYSRMYLGVHFPTDLFAGCLIGLFASSLSYFLLKRYFAYQRPPAEAVARHSRIPIAVGLILIAGMLVYSGIKVLSS